MTAAWNSRLKPIAGWVIIWGVILGAYALASAINARPASLGDGCPSAVVGDADAAQVLKFFYHDLCRACFFQYANINAYADAHPDVRVEWIHVGRCGEMAREYGIVATPGHVFTDGEHTSAVIYGVTPPWALEEASKAVWGQPAEDGLGN